MAKRRTRTGQKQVSAGRSTSSPGKKEPESVHIPRRGLSRRDALVAAIAARLRGNRNYESFTPDLIVEEAMELADAYIERDGGE